MLAPPSFVPWCNGGIPPAFRRCLLPYKSRWRGGTRRPSSALKTDWRRPVHDAGTRLLGVRQRAHVEPEADALRLTWPDRQIGAAQHKTADDIGASGNRLQRQLADRLREPFISDLLLATASGVHRCQAEKWPP
jgi:hypothetical protein